MVEMLTEMLTKKRRLLVVLLAMWVAWSAGAAPALRAADKADGDGDKDKTPPALTEYKGRRIAQTMHFRGAPWLTRESREREEEPAKLMKALRLKPGMTVCDMGCGNGFYSLKMAKVIQPKGKVLAVDIQPQMLSLLKQRASDAGVENVQPILGGLADPKLPAGSCDLILLVDVYHEFSHPVHMLAAMRKALKPAGRIVLVEFRTEDRDVPIYPLHKMSKAQVMKEIPANGYKLVEQYDAMPWQHVMFFQRDDGPDDAIEMIPWRNPKKPDSK